MDREGDKNKKTKTKTKKTKTKKTNKPYFLLKMNLETMIPKQSNIMLRQMVNTNHLEDTFYQAKLTYKNRLTKTLK